MTLHDKIYDGIRYLVLFSNSWYDKICDRIKYQIKWHHQ